MSKILTLPTYREYAHNRPDDQPDCVPLRRLPLADWAGDLPATGEGIKAAFSAQRHLWAIATRRESEWFGPWQLDPVLPQLAADILHGEVEIAGFNVPLMSVLHGSAQVRDQEYEAIENSMHAYILRAFYVYVYERPTPG